MKEEGKKLIQSIIYILMGLQIVLGGLWIGANLGYVSRFEESTELIAMSESLCVDEYTGILYPICIRVLFAIGRWTTLPGCALVYLVQLMIAAVAYRHFLHKVMCVHDKRAWFFAGFIITIPTIAQCHVGILPYSLVSSVFVILLADLIVLWQRKERLTAKLLLPISIWWVLSALICPDYGWLSGIAAGLMIVLYVVQRKRILWQLVIMCMASILCISIVSACVQNQGGEGKIQKTIGAAMVQRFVWPNFATFQHFWSQEVLALWDTRDLAGLAMYPEKVIYEFGPLLEQTYGKERANEIYIEMAKTAIGLDTKNIIQNMAGDMAAYVCPPVTMWLQLKGVGTSYTGWNYGRMKDYAPVLTGYYVEYALNAWVMVLLLGIGLWLLTERGHKKFSEKLWTGSFLCAITIVINLWYVMCSGNMQDYKKLIVNSVLCGFFVIRLTGVARIDKCNELTDDK